MSGSTVFKVWVALAFWGFLLSGSLLPAQQGNLILKWCDPPKQMMCDEAHAVRLKGARINRILVNGQEKSELSGKKTDTQGYVPIIVVSVGDSLQINADDYEDYSHTLVAGEFKPINDKSPLPPKAFIVYLRKRAKGNIGSTKVPVPPVSDPTKPAISKTAIFKACGPQDDAECTTLPPNTEVTIKITRLGQAIVSPVTVTVGDEGQALVPGIPGDALALTASATDYKQSTENVTLQKLNDTGELDFKLKKILLAGKARFKECPSKSVPISASPLAVTINGTLKTVAPDSNGQADLVLYKQDRVSVSANDGASFNVRALSAADLAPGGAHDQDQIVEFQLDGGCTGQITETSAPSLTVNLGKSGSSPWPWAAGLLGIALLAQIAGFIFPRRTSSPALPSSSSIDHALASLKESVQARQADTERLAAQARKDSEAAREAQMRPQSEASTPVSTPLSYDPTPVPQTFAPMKSVPAGVVEEYTWVRGLGDFERPAAEEDFKTRFSPNDVSLMNAHNVRGGDAIATFENASRGYFFIVEDKKQLKLFPGFRVSLSNDIFLSAFNCTGNSNLQVIEPALLVRRGETYELARKGRIEGA